METKTKRMLTRSKRYKLVLLLILGLLASCDNRKVYDEYCHAPIQGWEKNDYLSFSIPKLQEGGDYTLQLEMRTDNLFPFMSVVLIVDQKIMPAGKVHSDTIKCGITDERGNTLGKGVNIYQHSFAIGDRHLNKGDSLYITVRHDMKREMLPGVSDVGIALSRR